MLLKRNKLSGTNKIKLSFSLNKKYKAKRTLMQGAIQQKEMKTHTGPSVKMLCLRKFQKIETVHKVQ